MSSPQERQGFASHLAALLMRGAITQQELGRLISQVAANPAVIPWSELPDMIVRPPAGA